MRQAEEQARGLQTDGGDGGGGGGGGGGAVRHVAIKQVVDAFPTPTPTLPSYHPMSPPSRSSTPSATLPSYHPTLPSYHPSQVVDAFRNEDDARRTYREVRYLVITPTLTPSLT